MESGPSIDIPTQEPNIKHYKSTASEHWKNVFESLIVIGVQISIYYHTDNENQHNYGTAKEKEKEITMPDWDNSGF